MKHYTWGLFILLAIAPLEDLLRFESFISIQKLMGFVVIGSWLLHKLLRRAPAHKPPTSFVFAWLLLIVFNMLMGVLQAPSKSSVLFVLNRIGYLLIIILTIEGLCSLRRIQVATYCVVVSSFVVSALSITQMISGSTSFLTYNRPELITRWKGGPLRILGVGGDQNSTGTMLPVLIMVTLGVVITSRKRFWRIGAFVSATLSLFALFITYSRSGYLGLLGALTVFVILVPRSRRVLGALIALIVLLVIFSPFIAQIVSNVIPNLYAVIKSDDYSRVTHIEQYPAAVQIILENPFGVGLGAEISKTATENWWRTGSYGIIHNTFLEEAATSSILSMIALIFIIYGYFRYLWTSFQSCTNPIGRATLASFMAAVAAMQISWLFVSSSNRLFFWLVAAVGMAGAKVMQQVADSQPTEEPVG